MNSAAIEASQKLNASLKQRDGAVAPRQSLYDIASEILAAHQMREEAEYEGDAEMVASIDANLKEYLKEHLPAKVDSIRNYIRWQENQATVRTEEAKEQAILAGRAQDNIDRVKGMCLWVMQQLGVKKLDGGLHWLRRQGNGGQRAVEVRQPELVPPEYQEVSIKMPLAQWGKVLEWYPSVYCYSVSAPEPHTQAIRAALESGVAVPGCVLAERGEHVRTS